MKMIDLEPRWYVGWDGGPRIGLTFNCPHCQTQRLGVVFHHHGRAAIEDAEIHAHVPGIDHIWDMIGETLDDLTITPSVDASKAGHWHGFITAGEIR